jgi:hypothetical protein
VRGTVFKGKGTKKFSRCEGSQVVPARPPRDMSLRQGNALGSEGL